METSSWSVHKSASQLSFSSSVSQFPTMVFFLMLATAIGTQSPYNEPQLNHYHCRKNKAEKQRNELGGGIRRVDIGDIIPVNGELYRTDEYRGDGNVACRLKLSQKIESRVTAGASETVLGIVDNSGIREAVPYFPPFPPPPAPSPTP
jgi:hypothetical protein